MGFLGRLSLPRDRIIQCQFECHSDEWTLLTNLRSAHLPSFGAHLRRASLPFIGFRAYKDSLGLLIFFSLQIFDDPIPNVVDAPPPLGFASDDPPLLINQSSTQPLLPRAHSLLSGSVVQHNIQHSIDDNSAVPLTPLPNVEISANVSTSPPGLTNGSSNTKSGTSSHSRSLPHHLF